MGDPLKTLGQAGEVAGLYRLVTGFLITVLIGLVGVVGNDLRAGLADVRRDLGGLRADYAGALPQIGANKNAIEMLDRRAGRANDRHTDLDRRVTVIETRIGPARAAR